MEDRRLMEYLVIAGLPDDPEELKPGAQECGYKNSPAQAPITDICIVFPGLGEKVPDNFTIIDVTPSGFPGDLNHGSIRSPSCFLCYRRGYHKSPLIDIGVIYDGKEKLMIDSHVLQTTPFGRPANVNNASQGIFVTYRRALENSASSVLAVTDICVILRNKGEVPPHTFCMVNKNLNKGFPGSDVFICYKKTLVRANNISYKPAILDRFPRTDMSGTRPLPNNIAMFCLPMGATIECWQAKCQTPARVVSTFVLTDELGRKFYGTAVSFWEPYDRPLTDEQRERLGLKADQASGSCSDTSSTNDPLEAKTLHTNKCICIVSKFPFFTAFKRYLLYLYRMTIPSNMSYATPIERFISFLMYEVPFPTRRRPRVWVALGNETIVFENPENSHLPLSGANFIDMLKTLGSDNAMYLLLLAVLEHKILLHSLRPHILTSVAEALMSALFPFRWQCPYIPLCPLDFAGNIHAPVPFVIGVDSRYFELYDHPPPEVTCFDLDTNTISTSDVRKGVKLGMLPKRPARQLRQSLDDLCRAIHQEDWKVTIARHNGNILPLEVDHDLSKRKSRLEQDIQEAFLTFMTSLMKGYLGFLTPMHRQPSRNSTDAAARFDMQGFLRSRDKGSHDFYRMFMETQIFTRFVEERTFHADQDPFLVFFDQCMDKLALLDQPGAAVKGGRIRLLEPENPTVNAEPHTVHISAPEMHRELTPETEEADDPTRPGEQPRRPRYSYNGMPKLQLHLFDLDNLQRPVGIATEEEAAERGWFLNLQRTKVERERAQVVARKEFTGSPVRWAKCLLAYSYSLWFLHFPAYVRSHSSRTKALRVGVSILDRLQSARLKSADELCYRALIQLCFENGQPLLAVKVFMEMRREGLQPNAITYALYQRAILEAQWPSPKVLAAQRYWGLLKNLLRATARFKSAAAAGRLRKKRFALAQAQNRPSSVYSVTSSVSGAESDYISMMSARKEEASILEQAPVSKEEPPSPSDQGYGSQADSASCTQLAAPAYTASGGWGSLDRRLLQTRPNRGMATVVPVTKSMENLDVPEPSVDVDGASPSPQMIAGSQATLVSETVQEVPEPGATANGTEEAPVKEIEGDHEEAAVEFAEAPLARPSTLLDEIEKGTDPEDLNGDRSARGSLSPSEPVDAHSPEHPLGPPEDLKLEQEQEEHDDLVQKQENSLPKHDDPIRGLFLGDDDIPEDEQAPLAPLSSTRSEPRTPVLASQQSIGSLMSSAGSGVKNLWGKFGRRSTVDGSVSGASTPAGGLTPAAASPSSNPGELQQDQAEASSHTTEDSHPLLEASPSTASLSTLMASKVSQLAHQESLLKWGTKLKSSSNYLTSRLKDLSESSTKNMSTLSSSYSVDQLTRAIWGPTPPSSTGGGPCSVTPSPSVSTAFGLAGGAGMMALSGYTLTGGGWNEDSMSVGGGPAGDEEDDDKTSDPAFQLSSGETGSILSFDLSTGNHGSLRHVPSNASGDSGVASEPRLGPTCVDVTLSICTKCPECANILYDEDVLAGISPDDSDMTIRCLYCSKRIVPSLTVRFRRSRRQPRSLHARISRRTVRNNLVCGGTGRPPVRKRSGSLDSLPPAFLLGGSGGLRDSAAPVHRGPSVSAPGTPDHASYGSIFRDSSQSAGPLSSGLFLDELGGDAGFLCRPRALSNEHIFPPSSSSPADIVKFKARRKLNYELGGAAARSSVFAVGGGATSLKNQFQASSESSLLSPLREDPDLVSETQSEDGISKDEELLDEHILELNRMFLGPLFLRKELEDTLDQTGFEHLARESFAVEHDVLYWNLMYYFKRLSVPSHMHGWLPTVYAAALQKVEAEAARGAATPREGETDPLQGPAQSELGEVSALSAKDFTVRVVYDNPSAYAPEARRRAPDSPQLVIVPSGNASPVAPPLHLRVASAPTLHAEVLTQLSTSNLLRPIQALLHDYRKQAVGLGASPSRSLPRHVSVYRDLLFLALSTYPTQLDRDAFDREFVRALAKLPPKIQTLLTAYDKPPSLGAKACWKIFMPIDVL